MSIHFALASWAWGLWRYRNVFYPTRPSERDGIHWFCDRYVLRLGWLMICVDVLMICVDVPHG